jgi:hypothetical protein
MAYYKKRMTDGDRKYKEYIEQYELEREQRLRELEEPEK